MLQCFGCLCLNGQGIRTSRLQCCSQVWRCAGPRGKTPVRRPRLCRNFARQPTVFSCSESCRQMEEGRRHMLVSIMTPDARDRCRCLALLPAACAPLTQRATDHPPPSAVSRVSIVKPDIARAVEEHCIKQARAGKLMGKVCAPAPLPAGVFFPPNYCPFAPPQTPD